MFIFWPRLWFLAKMLLSSFEPVALVVLIPLNSCPFTGERRRTEKMQQQFHGRRGCSKALVQASPFICSAAPGIDIESSTPLGIAKSAFARNRSEGLAR